RLLYEGKAKKIYETEDKDLIIQFFKDDATAFDGKKHDVIRSKGIVNNRCSARLFKVLKEHGIPCHFVEIISDREMLVKHLEILPVEVVIRNIVAGSLAKRLGRREGERCPFPIVEFYYKSDELGDPLINDDHILAFNFATEEQINKMRTEGRKINEILKNFFIERGLILVDFKLEFGMHNGELMLGDEISPDTCRLWDAESFEKMDKDRFRRDLGGVKEAYFEVLKRIEG
ncbi:MAG: phosphoribosylaminoimidazolesuccinocarboxamide synthase, partial [Nitrospirae bacterium]